MALKDEALGNSGPAHELAINGRVYHVKLIDQYVQSEFSKKLLGRAKAVLGELKDLMTPQEFSQNLMKLNKDYMTGEYGLMSELGRQVVGTPEGILMLCGLIMNCSQPEVIRLMALHPAELTSTVKLVLQESFPGIDFDEKPANPAGQQEPAPVPFVSSPSQTV